MKNLWIKVFTIFFALLMLVNSVSAGDIHSNVTFQNDSERFFINFKNKNLFKNLDDKTKRSTFVQVLEISNHMRNKNGVDTYLKIVGFIHEDISLLKDLSLIADNGKGSIVIHNYHNTEGYKNFMLISSLNPGEKDMVTLTLQLPKEFSKEDIEKVEAFNWAFLTEEYSYMSEIIP